MTDWDYPSGQAGTLRIRDTGTAVEFWVYTDYTLYWNNLQFAITINGSTKNVSINYNGTKLWVKVYSENVTTNQTVIYKLVTATGTTSLGGPTTCSHAISRATVPGATSSVTLSNVTDTSVHAVFYHGTDGGAPIDAYQIGYGTNPSSIQTTVSSSGTSDIGGLARGTTYYFWARAHNSVGWGPWSARSQATTLNYPSPPSVPVETDITQVSAVSTITDNANGGTAILERQISVQETSGGTATYFDATAGGKATLTGLKPGTRYYIAARVRNSVGWSGWTSYSIITTIAGAWVNVNGVWKNAVPYVNVNGVWKVARPWGRLAGVWKESI